MTEMYKQLTALLKEHDHIFIMAHKNIDLDALGSSICMYKIVKSFKKECYIMLSKKENNNSIEKSLTRLKEKHINLDIVYEENYESKIKPNSLIIVLDTHKREMVECAELLDKVPAVVVIDHHIKNGPAISSTIFSYIHANLSSVNEFMVGYLRYLNKEIEPIIATIMLAGIEIDTNAFNTKTGITTYEAAAILARMGADNIMKQELLQENKELYMQRQALIQNSFRIKDNFEICVLDDQIYERKDLALIAEELLKFEDVEASFTIGRTSSNQIGISARSIGRVNVQRYMSLLGGGGHMTDAAAQIISKHPNEVKDMLLNIMK